MNIQEINKLSIDSHNGLAVSETHFSARPEPEIRGDLRGHPIGSQVKLIGRGADTCQNTNSVLRATLCCALCYRRRRHGGQYEKQKTTSHGPCVLEHLQNPPENLNLKSGEALPEKSAVPS
jgi:hypothetical protein